MPQIEQVWPYNLAYKVFNDINMVHRTYGPALEDALYTLTDREREVLRYRFIDGLTLRKTGEQFGITQERICQIEAKALRKLRHPSRSRAFLLENTIDKVRELEETCSRLAQENAKLRKRLHVPEEKPITVTPIEDLELSVRSYNCLARQGIRYVEDLDGWTVDRLMKVRNLGKRSLEEVVAKARDWGIEID